MMNTTHSGLAPPDSVHPMDPLDIIAGSGEAVYGVDEEGILVIWNRGAERLLGFPADRVIGKHCHEILHGRDVFGNLYCDRSCNLRKMARRRQAVRGFELDVQRADGDRLRAAISIVCVPGSRPATYTMLHLVRPVERDRAVEDLVHRLLSTPVPSGPADAPESLDRLTPREIEVLRLLASGAGNQQIAESLFISVATVRTHIEHILRKLDVHSKLEAVSVAHRNHLL
jgi:PAS domain S-box-containing protein